MLTRATNHVQADEKVNEPVVIYHTGDGPGGKAFFQCSLCRWPKEPSHAMTKRAARWHCKTVHERSAKVVPKTPRVFKTPEKKREANKMGSLLRRAKEKVGIMLSFCLVYECLVLLVTMFVPGAFGSFVAF